MKHAPYLMPEEIAEIRALRQPQTAREVCEDLRAMAERCPSATAMVLLYREADRIEEAARAAGEWDEG